MKRYKVLITIISAFCLLLPALLYSQSVDTAWVRRYNGPGNSSDQASAMTLDNLGNVYVTGLSGGSGTGADYATIKYNSNGNMVWVRRYASTTNIPDGASAIATDAQENIYVTGFSGYVSGRNIVTIKYNSNGDTLWVRTYDSPGSGDDFATAMAVDASGNVYVTGYSTDSTATYASENYTTIKYNSAGVQMWVANYNGTGNGSDEANAIALDGAGNIYVTGRSWDTNTHFDWVTIKYNSLGDTVWVKRMNGTYNWEDYASAIAVDSLGNVYVAGVTWNVSTYIDYFTIKYDSIGDLKWSIFYDGPTHGEDRAQAIVVDSIGNVYVTGYSVGSGTDYDYVTIKYVQTMPGVEENHQTLSTDCFSLKLYPNPAKSQTAIRYALPAESKVSLQLYDISGRLVKTLVNEQKKVGNYSTNINSQTLPAGVYFLSLQTASKRLIKRLVVVK
jgi:uncharacterized delta-60 repeat protein